jgi:hypothetical protein
MPHLQACHSPRVGDMLAWKLHLILYPYMLRVPKTALADGARSRANNLVDDS